MSIKRTIAGILACAYLFSMAACDKQSETDSSIDDTPKAVLGSSLIDSNNNNTAAETTPDDAQDSDNASDSSASEESDTDAETTAADTASKNFELKPSSGIVVADVGNYETYFDDFKFPDTYVISAYSDETAFSTDIGYDGRLSFIRFAFHLDKTENSTEYGDIEYTLYMSDKDAYGVMTMVNDEESKTQVQHATVENQNDKDDIRKSVSSMNWSRASIEYVDYQGEETINGLTYDALNCKMTMDDETLNAVSYFTKDGEYFRTDFLSEDEGKGYIQAISEINMPDLSDAEETDITDLSMTFVGTLFIGAMSSVYLENKMPLPLREG